MESRHNDFWNTSERRSEQKKINFRRLMFPHYEDFYRHVWQETILFCFVLSTPDNRPLQRVSSRIFPVQPLFYSFHLSYSVSPHDL